MPLVPRSSKTPSYRKHKASGQAIVSLDGRMFYLGPYGTAANRQEYDRVVAEWLQAGCHPLGHARTADLTASELLARYWVHAQTYTLGWCRNSRGDPPSDARRR